MKYILTLICICSLFLVSCGAPPTPIGGEAAKGEIIGKDIEFWQANKFVKMEGPISYATSFEEELPYSWTGDYSIALSGDITLTNQAAAHGDQAIKFRVTPQSDIHGGTRSEVIWRNYDQEGTTVFYKWNFMVPESYQNVPIKAQDGRNNWQMMGQWHKEVGGEGSGPPIAFYWGYDPEQDINGLAFNYGVPDQPKIGQFAIQKGMWYELVTEIKWSQQDDGYAKVYLNRELVVEATGANMHNEIPHFFKMGLYRHPDIQPIHEVLYDGFVVGYNRDLVANYFNS